MTEIVADSFAGGKLAQYLFATAAMDGVRGLYVTVDSASARKGPERLPEFSTAWRARVGEYERLFEICGSHRPMDLDLIVVADIAALFPRASYDQERREPYEARGKATRSWMRLCKEDKALRSTAVIPPLGKPPSSRWSSRRNPELTAWLTPSMTHAWSTIACCWDSRGS